MEPCEECIQRVVEQLDVPHRVAWLLIEMRERKADDPRAMVHVGPAEVEGMRKKVVDVRKEMRDEQQSLFGEE